MRLSLNRKGSMFHSSQRARVALFGLAASASLLSTGLCRADSPEPTRVAEVAPARPDTSAGSTRYGWFNALDHRSRYGQYWFVEPLRGPEMDVDREFRVDWFHGEDQNLQQDEVKAEIEYNFGLLTVELELPYEREAELSADG